MPVFPPIIICAANPPSGVRPGYETPSAKFGPLWQRTQLPFPMKSLRPLFCDADIAFSLPFAHWSKAEFLKPTYVRRPQWPFMKFAKSIDIEALFALPLQPGLQRPVVVQPLASINYRSKRAVQRVSVVPNIVVYREVAVAELQITYATPARPKFHVDCPRLRPHDSPNRVN
jgi:hypothetical protein